MQQHRCAGRIGRGGSDDLGVGMHLVLDVVVAGVVVADKVIGIEWDGRLEQSPMMRSENYLRTATLGAVEGVLAVVL